MEGMDGLLEEATGRATRIAGGQDGAVLELGRPSRILDQGERPTTVVGSSGIWTPEGERKHHLTLMRANGAPAAPQAPTPTLASLAGHGDRPCPAGDALGAPTGGLPGT